MKKKQFESICKTLLPYLPGFSCKGWLLYAQPLNHVLRGFCCDTSGFDPDRFAVYVFFLPLFVPRKHVSFNMGDRLRDDDGCEIWWNMQEPNLSERLLDCIRKRGLPFLTGVEDPKGLIFAIQRLSAEARRVIGDRQWSDPYLEAMAYTHIMVDDYDGAQSELNRLTELLDSSVPWQVEMLERADALKAKLGNDPEGAKRLLLEWEQATVTNLGLWNTKANPKEDIRNSQNE